MSDEKLYKLICLVFYLLGRIPRPLLLFFSDCIALIWFMVDKRHRNLVIENIQKAYPGKYNEKTAKAFAFKNFRHTASILFEVAWSYSLKKEKLFEFFTVKNSEYLENALKKGRGAIALTCHMSVFELMIPAIAKTGVDPYVLYRQLDFKPLDWLIRDIRERFGTTMIPLRGASKKVDIFLKENHLVGTLLDQNVDWYKGVFADFFGRPACTNNGLAKLVLRANPAVLPVFIRKEKGQFIFEFLREIPLIKTGDMIKDIENNTQLYVSAIEKMVRVKPEQYFWVHNRWKTKPYCLLNQG